MIEILIMNKTLILILPWMFEIAVSWKVTFLLGSFTNSKYFLAGTRRSPLRWIASAEQLLGSPRLFIQILRSYSDRPCAQGNIKSSCYP